MIVNDPLIGGVSEIADGKWIQWSLEWSVSTNRCLMILKEASFHEDILESYIRIHFDEFSHERPPSIFIQSFAPKSIGSRSRLSICIAHCDGTVQKLVIHKSDESSSFLAALDALSEDVSGTSLLKVSTLLLSKLKNVTMKVAPSTATRNRIVSCLHWCSSQHLIYGLRGGDTLLVAVEEEGKGLILTECLLRDADFLRVLWNGIMQADNCDKATIGLYSIEINNSKENENIIISVDSEGVLRLWNTKNRKCVVQASLSQVLKDFIVFENLEDVNISAAVSDSGNVVHISIALSSRPSLGAEKEWHVAVIECNSKDISSTTTNNDDVIMRLMCVLSPPICPSPLAQESKAALIPILLDLQLYPSRTSSLLVAAWKWSWQSNSRNDVYNKGVLSLSVLSTYRIPLANNSVNRIDKAFMNVHDESSSSVGKFLRLANEDIAVCELILKECAGTDNDSNIERKLQLAMIQRIFQPNRFELNTIVSVLTDDVPESCKCTIKNNLLKRTDTNSDSDLLAACVHNVVESCQHWATLLETTSENIGTLSIDLKLQNQARSFLYFLELCEHRANIDEGFLLNCLQRPNYFSQHQTIDLYSTTVGLAITRKSLGFLYLTIPTEDIISHSPSFKSYRDMTGKKAIEIVENALNNNSILTEIDIKLQRTFQENAVLNTGNLNWLSSYINILAASIQSISPGILDLLQSTIPSDLYNARGDSTKEWFLAYFGDSECAGKGSFCHPDESFPSRGTHTRDRQEINNRNILNRISPSLAYVRAVSKMAGSEIHRLYCAARTKAVLFSVLAATGGSLHSSVCSIMVTDLIPQALYSMVYWGLLLWLDTIRSADNSITSESVDVFDLFLTSVDIKDEMQNSNSSYNTFFGSLSLWESFCNYSICSSHITFPLGVDSSLHLDSKKLVETSRSSPINDFFQYLSLSSQHSAISRISSLFLWGNECIGKGRTKGRGKGLAGTINDYSICDIERRTRIENLANIVVHGRLRTSVALASFLECLRQILRCRFDTNCEEGTSSNNNRHNLLSKELYIRLEDLIMAVTSPSTNSTADLADLDDTVDDIDSNDEFHILFNEMLYNQRDEDRNRNRDGNSNGDGKVQLNSKIQCLHDRLCVMFKTSNAFIALIKERNHIMKDKEIDACVRCCCTSPELFLHLHLIAHLSDVVEMTKRIRDITMRPNDSDEKCYGAALAIRANYALADAVDDMLSALLPSNNYPMSEGLAVRLHMSAEQTICWSRVFEHAIEQLSFDEAFAAVVRLVKLSHNHEPSLSARVKDILDSFGASDWHAALESLVMHACTTGRLGWLCSLDDIWVSGVHISGLIADELAKLASSGYSCMDGINSPSYYECACIYALSRQNLQEAARMSVVHIQTLNAQQQIHGQASLLSDNAQIRALSVAVVALSALKPQLGAYVLLRTRAPFSSGNRQYDATLKDDEARMYDKSLPSYDHLSMRTVQQLSVSLQLRLTLSKINSAGCRGGKEFSALHLAVGLDALEDSDMLQLEQDGLRPSDVVSLCLDEKHLRGSGFLSNAAPSSSSSIAPGSYRSAVIFAIASATTICRQYDSNSNSGSSSNGGSSSDHRLYSQYIPQGGKGLSFCVGTSTFINWSPLLDALAHFDTPSLNWALHKSAFEGILKAGMHEVPPALISSYKNCGGDMAVFLRILMSYGRLLEACHIAIGLIESYSIQGNSNMPNTTKCKVKNQIIPYKIIDEVILASKKYFQISSLAVVSSLEEEIQRDRVFNDLKSQVAQLERAIKMHFTVILAAEML